MTSTSLPLDKLRLDGGTQSRVALKDETVEEYAEKMQAGKVFPAVTVFYDGSVYWLADGFHRWHAAKKASAKKIECDVRQGTQDDAIWFSLGANAEHGLKRSHADVRQAIERAFKHQNAVGKSDRKIADHIGCSQPTVSTVRKGLEAGDKIYHVDGRQGKDGKTYPSKSSNPKGRTRSTPAAENVAPSQSSDDAGEDEDDTATEKDSIPTERTPESIRTHELLTLLMHLLGGGPTNALLSDYLEISLRKHVTQDAYFGVGRKKAFECLRDGDDPTTAVQEGASAIHEIYEEITTLFESTFRQALDRYVRSTSRLTKDKRYAAIVSRAFHKDTPLEEAITAAEKAANL